MRYFSRRFSLVFKRTAESLSRVTKLALTVVFTFVESPDSFGLERLPEAVGGTGVHGGLTGPRPRHRLETDLKFAKKKNLLLPLN